MRIAAFADFTMESLEALSQALLTVYRKVYSKAVFYTVENFYLILLFDL